MSTTEFDGDTGTGTTSENSRIAAARAKASEKLGSARARAKDAYSTARERTGSAYGSAASSARENAAKAGRRTADGIDANPVGALVGGLALGALVAALLPKTRREEELIGDYGRRLSDTARQAARAASDAGRGKLDELGLNRDAAKQTFDTLANKAGEAARTSASAAARTVKGSGAS